MFAIPYVWLRSFFKKFFDFDQVNEERDSEMLILGQALRLISPLRYVASKQKWSSEAVDCLLVKKAWLH